MGFVCASCLAGRTYVQKLVTCPRFRKCCVRVCVPWDFSTEDLRPVRRPHEDSMLVALAILIALDRPSAIPAAPLAMRTQDTYLNVRLIMFSTYLRGHIRTVYPRHILHSQFPNNVAEPSTSLGQHCTAYFPQFSSNQVCNT